MSSHLHHYFTKIGGNVSLPSSSSKPSFLADYSNPTPGDSGPSSKTTQIFMPKANQSLTKINLAMPHSPLLQRRESRSLGRPHVNSTFEGPISGKRKSSATSIPERIVQVFDGFRRDSNGIRRTSVDKQRPPPSTTLILNDSETKQVQPISSTVPLSPNVNSVPLKIHEPKNHEVCMKSSIIENHDLSLAPKRVEADNSSLFSLIVHDSGSNDDEFLQEATMSTFHEVLSQPFSQIAQHQTSMLSVPTSSNPAINNTNIIAEEFNIKKKALSSIEEKQQISSVSPEPDEEPLSKEVPFNIFLSIFLLPAFDGKGKIIDVELFDKEDTKNVSFLVNGIHPKSYFHTLWDLLTVCASLVYLWYIPFLATFSSFETRNSEIVSLACTITFTLDTVVELATPKPSEINPLCSLREYEMA
ncbi:hypothetical protein BCR33DRAFT_371148 [Rhizoclosmatium globosum]|uniref:Ion transport domain-containing protein n=1 Tax=Rhizoclosmatium globosum TaxID=329046 RepID=A0A1Y2BZV4_9FUNG|nr:hypothetical protein BCR33DRAFT_371148 [Rhizoclosmatium globosum]|eukprot:ORY40157.1 hypothetical protein BCR33DRAFT_371148 [Rhizoclosmatium globosum]